MAIKVKGNQVGLGGTVKMWAAAHRYGFIQPDDGGNDIFFDHNAVAFAGLQDVMAAGLPVVFDLQPDPKGRRGHYQAVNLAAANALDPAAHILRLEDVIRQLFDALPAETRQRWRQEPAIADIVDAPEEHTA